MLNFVLVKKRNVFLNGQRLDVIVPVALMGSTKRASLGPTETLVILVDDELVYLVTWLVLSFDQLEELFDLIGLE